MEIIYEDIIKYYEKDITEVLSNKSEYYHIFDVTKNSGGKRRISEPLTKLKDIQKVLYSEIFYPKRYLIHKCAYAYMPNVNIHRCIEKHVGKDIVVKMDIKSFFDSITEKLVKDSLLYAFRMKEEIADIVTDLCTFDGKLPQGAVTSPILSNFVCRILDRRLNNYCEKYDIEYSRYADDMIFSGDFEVKELIHYVSWALGEYYSFKLNYDKLRIMRSHQRQVVLGVLVNQTCRLTKKKRRELRQELYYIKKYGIDDYIGFTGKNLDKMKGYVSYALGISEEPFIEELHEILRTKK